MDQMPEDNKSPEAISPGTIAKWNYTDEEWKLMSREEANRRLKEGAWVSLIIGLLGGWALSLVRDSTFLNGFLFSLGFGILLSIIKILLSNNLFKPTANNSITLTSDALLINDKRKVIRDEKFYLDYVKLVKHKENSFLEFSLQWQTRRGATNDQFRIYVPPLYENEIPLVIKYYNTSDMNTEYK